MDALTTLPGYRPRYLALATLLVDGYLDAGPLAVHAPPLAAQLALLFWLDDRLDESPAAADPASLVHALREGAPDPSPEARAFSLLEASLWQLCAEPSQRALWRESLASVVDAMGAEALLSRDGALLGYAEYTAVGARTSTMPHFFTTLGWLAGEPLRRGLDEPTGAAVVRKLALHARLQNDLHSLARDEREGCAANAVLLLAAEHGLAGARSLVQRELDALEAQLARVLALRPSGCVLRALAPAVLRSHARFYEKAHDRYGPAAPGQPVARS